MMMISDYLTKLKEIPGKNFIYQYNPNGTYGKVSKRVEEFLKG